MEKYQPDIFCVSFAMQIVCFALHLFIAAATTLYWQCVCVCECVRRGAVCVFTVRTAVLG